jgi:uncharacterized membrane protein
METRRRSLAKAMSWRFFATFITMSVAFVITGELTFALEIGLLDTAVKFLTYFGHERLWVRIQWGKQITKSPDYNI